MEQTRLDGADFEGGTGTVHLVGSLTLNYDKVQLVADIDLASLRGTGHLVLVEEAGSSQRTRSSSAASNGAASNGAASNGTASNGTASNGTASNGAASNGAASNGAASTDAAHQNGNATAADGAVAEEGSPKVEKAETATAKSGRRRKTAGSKVA
jgi:MbtH protein